MLPALEHKLQKYLTSFYDRQANPANCVKLLSKETINKRVHAINLETLVDMKNYLVGYVVWARAIKEQPFGSPKLITKKQDKMRDNRFAVG